MVKTKNSNMKHIHLTFEKLIGFIKNIIDSNDDFSDIVEDYENYCYESGLISDMDKKIRYTSMRHNIKKLDIRLCGTTYETNKKLNLYYCPSSWGYQRCKYLGLYTKKEVRNIGEITAIAVIEAKNGNIKKLEFSSIEGNLTEEMKENAQKAFEASYQKISPRAPRGKRIFNLQEVLELEKNQKLPSTAEIAELLKTKEW